MTRNMGNTDRVIRTVLGVLLLALWVLGSIKGVLGIVLGVVGLIFILTSTVSFCPIYSLFGMRTCPVKNKT